MVYGGFPTLAIFVAQAESVKRAGEGFRRLGYQVFLPVYLRKVRGRDIEVYPFASYLFVWLPEGSRWREALGSDEWRICYGLVRLLPLGCEVPVAVPVGLVEGLRGRAEAGLLDPLRAEAEIAYVVGQSVRFSYGALDDRVGVVSADGVGTVNLDFALLGRRLTLTVPKRQVSGAVPPPKYCRDWTSAGAMA